MYSALAIKIRQRFGFIEVSTFKILGFKLPFSVLFFIEQIVGKVLFLTLLGIFGSFILLTTGQLVFRSQ